MSDWAQSPSVRDCVRASVREELQAIETCSSAPQDFPMFLDLACRKSLLHKDLIAAQGLEPRTRGL